MTGKPEDFFVQDAHADAEATRKAMPTVTDASQLLKLQTVWARADVERSLAYWRSMYQTVMETVAKLVKCVYSKAPIGVRKALKAADLDASKQTLLGMIHSAYKQWVDATQPFYRLPAKPSERTTA